MLGVPVVEDDGSIIDQLGVDGLPEVELMNSTRVDTSPEGGVSELEVEDLRNLSETMDSEVTVPEGAVPTIVQYGGRCREADRGHASGQGGQGRRRQPGIARHLSC